MQNIEEKTVSIAKANLFGFLITLPLLTVFLILYNSFSYTEETIPNLRQSIRFANENYGVFFHLVGYLSVVTIGIVIHELIHGFCWAIFAKKGFKSITFGVKWEFLTAYCHCKEPLKIKHYIFGAVMPGIILGLLPTLYAIFIDQVVLFFFGLLFILAAGGDLLMVLLLRNESKNTYVQDHPSEVGCYIYKPMPHATK